MATAGYRRMLFVGLGGSGGKTLRYLKRDLNQWLDSVGWESGLPLGWQFLQIDTPTVQDGAELQNAPMLEDSEYLGLVGDGTTFDAIDQSLMGNKQNRNEFSSWRVQPAALGVPVQTGAGQYRAVGRSIALAYLGVIRNRLEEAFGRLSQANAQSSLTALFMHIHNEAPAAVAAPPIVVVVSSLAGGTGAGLINDVCDLLREIDPVAGEASLGLLYTPEVFSSIAPSAKGGIQPNSLAAICEVLNGYWWHGGSGSDAGYVPRKSSPIRRAAGAVTSIEKTGPSFPFLIGAQNSAGIRYESDAQLFEVVGTALTSWATDITVQSELLAYTISNWKAREVHASIQTSNVLVNQGSPTQNEPAVNPFSALGFSRVSVGNKYFGRYSTERLAKDAIDFLRQNHEMGGSAQALRQQQPNISAKELTAKQCEQNFPWFLNICKLNERGSTSDQVQDAIKPTPSDWEAIFYDCVNQAVQMSALAGNHTAADWMTAIEPAVVNAAELFDQRCQPIIDAKVLRWIEDQPKVVTNAVVVAVGQYGLRVTEALVAKLIEEISDPIEGIIPDLREEINKFAGWAAQSRWSKKAEAAFTQPTKKVPGGQVVEFACTEGLTDAICTTWIRVKHVSIELLNEFVVGFLEPLRQSLYNAAHRLDSEAAEVGAWPTWSSPGTPGSLSPSSVPPLSEWTLIDKSEFSELFDNLLSQTIGGGVGESVAERAEVRAQTVCGHFIEDLISAVPEDARRLVLLKAIHQTNAWWPGVSVVPNSSKPPSIATFNVGFDVSTIKGRAEKWLHLPSSPFERVLNDSLRSFTAPPNGQNAPGVTDRDYQARQRAMLSAFQSAINASQPLVGLNPALMAVLLGDTSHPALAVEVSSVPFEEHPLYDDAVALLRQEFEKSPVKKSAERYFNKDVHAQHIDIVTSLYGAYPTLVVSSLLMPIAKSWNALTTDGSRAAFWDKRRARGLAEFIPAPQEHILCMLRGWFLGRILGLVHSYDPTLKNSFTVAPRRDDLGTTTKNLPAIPLSTSNKWGDEPAVILESLGLAYVEVAAQNSLEPLKGYINLLELGKEGNGLGLELSSYGEISDYVTTWVRTGTVTLSGRFKPQREPLISVSGADQPTQARYTALADALTDMKTQYAHDLADYGDLINQSPNALGATPLWPSMYSLIDAALGQILAALMRIGDFGDSSSGGVSGNDNFLAR